MKRQGVGVKLTSKPGAKPVADDGSEGKLESVTKDIEAAKKEENSGKKTA